MVKEMNPKLELLRQIVKREQDSLFRFAYMRTGSRSDAEDIVQDVLLGLFRSSERLDKVASVRSYLLKSIANKCTDYHRSHKFCTVSLEEAGNLRDEGINQDKDLLKEYYRYNLLLEGLPQEQSEVIRLRCYDGLKFSVISEITGVKESSVKSRYRYAMQYLRNKLKKVEN